MNMVHQSNDLNMELVINTNQHSNCKPSLKNEDGIANKPEHADRPEFSSRGRFHQLSFDAYYMEYRVRGILRWLLHKLGFITQMELPPNVMVQSRLKYGLWLVLTIQNYSFRTDRVRIIKLTPIFLPGFKLARKSHKTIADIIYRNGELSDPEMFFVMPRPSEPIVKKVPVKKRETGVEPIHRFNGVPGKSLA